MLRNYRNYQPSWSARNAAQYHQRMAGDAQSAINRERNRIHGDYLKRGSGHPMAGQYYDHHMNTATQPYVAQMQQHNLGFHQNMANAMMAEQTQVDDRKMDLADNEQGRKNLDTEYNRQIEMEKLAAAERMNERNNQGLDSLSNSFSGIADGLISDPMQVPNYDLYDNGKNRIGGSYFGNALLG